LVSFKTFKPFNRFAPFKTLEYEDSTRKLFSFSQTENQLSFHVLAYVLSGDAC